MLPHYQAVRQAAIRISTVIDNSVKALRDGRVEHEPAMTDRMLGALEENLRSTTIKGIKWTAKTLTDRGSAAQEKVDGADFMGVLNINLPDYKVSKGFLAQAKLVRNQTFAGHKKLREQCEQMLQLSPASFVFLYSTDGVRVVSATSVIASNANNLEDLYARSGQRFFEEHLQCFIGDRAVHAATPATLAELRQKRDLESLERLRAEYKARTAFMLIGKSGQ